MRTVIAPALLGFLVLLAPAVQAEDSTAAQGRSCIDVEPEDGRSAPLTCLNRSLELQVEREHAMEPPSAGIDARSESNVVGVFNDYAAHEMMGNQFGVSSHPQRPRQPEISPLIPTPKRP